MTKRTNPPTIEPAWRIIDHTADIRVEVCGNDPEQLFLNAAQALTEILGAGRPDRAEHGIVVSLESSGLDELLVDWLREILFYNQARGWVFVGAEVELLSETTLKAAVSFGLRSGENEPELEIKAVTYHGLSVESSDRGYCAKVLFDI